MGEDKFNHVQRLAIRFLMWFCPDYLFEEIEGDLIQKFNRDVQELGERRAKRRFVWNVIRFFRPEIIFRNKFSFEIISIIMLRNYVTIAFRNVAKNKVFSAINIFGLSIGLAACLLIFQFVSFELSYDRFHDHFDRIYRVTNDRFQNGKLIQHGTITYPTIGPTMAKDFPEIEMYTRLMPSGDLNVRIDDKDFRGDRCHFADEHFLSVFRFSLLAGDRVSALKESRSIVLTEALAKKYFEGINNDYSALIGKVLYRGTEKEPYKVTGICQNIPDNSHIQFNALVSYATLHSGDDKEADVSWKWSDFRHYLLLKPGADYKALEGKFGAFSDRYFQGDKVSGSVEKFFLQPLKDAHLYSDYEYDIAKTASGKAVWAMLVVAVFILLIAWINYINLTTSRALDRAKEVGLRKVMGALKTQLVKQFIFESMLITLLAFVTAILFVEVVQSSFNLIIGGNLSLWKILSEMDATAIVIISSVMVAGVILSGFYPAFVLSAYQPVTVLKGKFHRSSGGRFMRKALVIFQFTASAALITGTLIVSRQLKFMNEADLGMNIQNVLIVRAPAYTQWDSTFIERVENYKHQLSQIDVILSVATSSRLPGDRLGRGFEFRLSDQPSSSHYTISHLGADYNFFDTYGISIITGRKFLPTDHNADYSKISTAIINQNAVSLLGIESATEAIGKEIVLSNNRWRIIGVVNDFHQESLKKPMEPIIFIPTYSTYGPTSIRYQTADTEALIVEVEKVYKKFFPDNAFSYVFLEDSYKSQYNDEKRLAKVIMIFTALGIIISCLGLIGLSSYTAVQRTKEIGIRKALGASLASIVTLLSADFIKLVLAAIILAFPIAYYFMANWLTNYPYRISLQWFLFMLPALMILFIAAITISFQIIRTARINPANTLKYE
ncbi:MAG: ABC transporter permease [Cyclobacteriaceae bacterium]